MSDISKSVEVPSNERAVMAARLRQNAADARAIIKAGQIIQPTVELIECFEAAAKLLDGDTPEPNPLACRYCPARFMTAWEHEVHEKEHAPETEGALQIERDVYCLALSRLVRKLEEVHEDPRYKAVWESFMIHGGKYTEPTYTEEFESAKKMLRHFQTEPPAMKAGEEQP